MEQLGGAPWRMSPQADETTDGENRRMDIKVNGQKIIKEELRAEGEMADEWPPRRWATQYEDVDRHGYDRWVPSDREGGG